MRARCVLVLALLALGLVACRFQIDTLRPRAPRPPTVWESRETEHAVVWVDTSTVGFVESVCALVERDHVALSRAFGGEPFEKANVHVCTRWRSYRERTDMPADIEAVSLKDGEEDLVVRWPGGTLGPRYLAVGLARRFTRAFLPAAPAWLADGLPRELAHGCETGPAFVGGDAFGIEVAMNRLVDEALDGVGFEVGFAGISFSGDLHDALLRDVRERSRAKIAGDAVAPFLSACHGEVCVLGEGLRGRCSVERILERFDADDLEARVADLTSRSTPGVPVRGPDARHMYLAPACVRFLIETKRPKTVCELASMELDPKEFVAWIASLDGRSPPHTLFPPLTSIREPR